MFVCYAYIYLSVVHRCRDKRFNFHLIPHIHSVHEFADQRVCGGENAPNIFAVLDVSSMTTTLTIEWIDFLKFFTLIYNKISGACWFLRLSVRPSVRLYV